MAVGVSYQDKDGKPKEFVLEEGDDTNLILGGWKSPFTVLRSWYDDKDDDGKAVKRYEFWVKCPKFSNDSMIYAGKRFSGASSLTEWQTKLPYDSKFDQYGWTFSEVGDYPERPSDRPRKLMFDSCRTAIANYFMKRPSIEGYTLREDIIFSENDTVGNWIYAGGVEKYSDGNFSLYGCIAEYSGKYKGRDAFYQEVELERKVNVMLFAYESCSTAKIKDILLNSKILKGNEYNETFNFLFSDKIAEIRDWDIVENNTPVKNVYYVVIENRKGKVIEVRKAEFGEEVEGKIVKDDIVIFK